MGALQKNPVLYCHGRQFTGSDSQEGELGDRLGPGENLESGPLPLSLVQGLVRRPQELLPRLLADGEAEEGLIRPWLAGERSRPPGSRSSRRANP